MPPVVYDELVARFGLSDSHRLLVAPILPGAYVLDVGCSTGYLASFLRDGRGCRVVGVEPDPDAAARAEEACWRVLVGGIDVADIRREVQGLGPFVAIVCGDVLEHIPDPSDALRFLRSVLAPGGILVASIPNIAHWTARAKLARGRFPLDDQGLFDRTHLRFLTRETATALFASTGFRTVAETHTPGAIPGEGVLWRLGYRIGENVAPPMARRLRMRLADARPELFALQLVFTLVPKCTQDSAPSVGRPRPTASARMPSRGVLVLGMHRSGTSAITRVIDLLGVPVGSGDLMPATEANPTGYWEVAELERFNSELLHRLGGDWSELPRAWRLRGERWLLRDERSSAAEVFARHHTGRSWVWKDPRNCVLLPFWNRVLGHQHAAVLVHRHPVETAASLRRRDGLDFEAGLALWEKYLRCAIRNLHRRAVFVVSFEELLAKPEAMAEELARFLARHGIVGIDPALDRSALRGFVDPGLRHHRAGSAADVELSTSQRRLLKALDAASGPHERFRLSRARP